MRIAARSRRALHVGRRTHPASSSAASAERLATWQPRPALRRRHLRRPSGGSSRSSSPISSASRRVRRAATRRRCASSSRATSTPAAASSSCYGGTVEKFIGDAVMAVWGTPTATEDDAERAVRAALDLVAAVTALGDEVGAPELRARAGVLTGEAAVTLGAEGQGMVAGDLVNTASRIQSIAEPGTVVVGRDDPAGDRPGDRLRGRRPARAQGEDRARPASGRRCASSPAPAAHSSRQGSRRRSSAGTVSCAGSRTCSTRARTRSDRS